MNKEAAEALALKRNAHKGRSLAHKTWRAREQEYGSWKVVLEDTMEAIKSVPVPAMTSLAARAAVGAALLNSMDPETRERVKEAASALLMERVRRTLGQ